APPPRLFVVFGDGEAEELLFSRDAQEALRLAQKDPDSIVYEGERLSWPMDGCLCHTMHRIAPMDPVHVRLRPLELPPCIAGFVVPAEEERTFTEFRQFTEYPAISEEHRRGFHQALATFAAQEADQKARHEAFGQGMYEPPKKAPDHAAGGGA
ncbi:unnamed protein product, partial [Polarella glacialis]